MENIICVSRQYGSGGREIGEAAARRLGVPCYDKCLVQRAARETGLSPRAVAERDETGDALELSLSGNPFAVTAALGEAFYSEELQVYEAERRCAAAILRQAGYRPLSVFLYADEESRARRIAARCGIDEKQALRKAREVDRLRRRHFDFFADTRWGQPESYDLMLSAAEYGVEGAAEIIIAAAARKGGASHE